MSASAAGEAGVEMAMFPLGTVLLPGEILPLHIFEARYRQMISDLLARDDDPPEFGVVLIERGSETGGGDQRTAIGTVAVVTHLEALEDGRYALVAVGQRRIEVRSWLPDAPYPRAMVTEVRDLPTDRADLELAVATTHLRVLAVHHLAVEVGEVAPGQDLAISSDPIEASYQLASLSPLGPLDRQQILRAEGPMQRLDTLDRVLDDVEAMLKFRSS